jgi:hypothetical protein
MKGNDFEMYGNLVSYAEMGLNSAVGGNSGIINIKFPNGAHYECSLPACEISGLVFGDRRVREVYKGFVLNRQNRMFTEISFGKDKKDLYPNSNKMFGSDIIGGIFTVTDNFMAKYIKSTHKPKL